MFRLALHWQILIGVVAAAAIGVTLNATASQRESRTPLEAEEVKSLTQGLPAEEADTLLGNKKSAYLYVKDTVDRITIKVTDADGKTLADQRYVIDPLGNVKGPRTYLTLEKLREKAPAVYRLFRAHGRSTARVIGDIGHAAGNLFLRMLKMVSVPLIITSLLSGVLGLADAGRLRKLFSMTIAYYIATSALAVSLGIFLVNLIRPGARGEVAESAEVTVTDDLGTTLYNQLQNLIPENPFGAVANADFLSIIAFTLTFGVFTILVGGHTLRLFRELAEAGFAVMMRLTMAIIYLAPVGVFALMLYATATQGHEVFQRLAWYLLTVFLGLLIHAAVILPLIIYFVARRNPLEYAQALSPALLTAFSSASSNATLPLTMSCVEERAGISNRIGSFVLPLGATVNMDGTALFEVVAVLFIAQVTPDVNLTVAQQFLIAVTALLASIGAAGIPSAGLVMMVIVLQAVGLPTDRVALILAVDRILDMVRTSVNVWSDACGCAVVARFDGGGGPAPAAPEPPLDGQEHPPVSQQPQPVAQARENP